MEIVLATLIELQVVILKVRLWCVYNDLHSVTLVQGGATSIGEGKT
jgi:hypothetical protein